MKWALVLAITLLQTQVYFNTNGRVVHKNVINRGTATTMDGCLAMARSWAQSYTAMTKYEISPLADGFTVTRPTAIGTERVTLQCRTGK